ncbi:MAG: DUF1838 domain-containing protein [Leptolyngbya sp. SIOISBB]|nr:DUF1838 domain-containing protein [Leptolyngbya sp. SIOISBB]
MRLRAFITSLLVGMAVLPLEARAITATMLDLEQPEDFLVVFRKVLCSLADGEVTYFTWQGQVYSRVPGERDRHLFNVQGMSARACGSLTSETGEAGFRQVTREVMLYLDPETNTVLETWQNPWTEEINTVVPVANDPVNSGPFWETATAQRISFDRLGDTDLLFLTFTIPLFYPNPLGGEYQSYMGGHYHAMEMFNFTVGEQEVLRSVETTVPVAITWSRISPWLPWMAMGSRPGELVFHAAGARVTNWEDLPEPLREQIATEFSLYQLPPPLDDDRPNQTTWTNFRDYLDSQPQP